MDKIETDAIEIKISRIKLAFAVAVVADMFEFPINLIGSNEGQFWKGTSAAMATVLDFIVMWIMTKLLGYHWVFWPTFFIEVVPKYDQFPTWVVAVGYVARERKKARETQPNSPPPRPLIDVEQIKAVGSSLVTRLALSPPKPQDARDAIPVETSPPLEAAVEERLKRLSDLRDKNLISEAEYESKRQQILADI